MSNDRETWKVAEYVDAIRRRDPTAPERFLRCAKRLASSKARRLRLAREDAEDAVMNAYYVSFEDGGAALARVRSPTTTLCGWISRVLDHLLADVARSRARACSTRPSDGDERRAAQRSRLAAERTDRLGPAGHARLGALTSSQREAFDLHLQGLSSAVIAARLGIGRDAVRERVWRSWAHMGSGARPWAHGDLPAYLDAGGPTLGSVERETLELLATGASYLQVALRRGESRDAVRSRVSRVRRRAGAKD